MREQQQLPQDYADYLDMEINRLTCRLDFLEPIHSTATSCSTAALPAFIVGTTYCCYHAPGAIPYGIINCPIFATCTGIALLTQKCIDVLTAERQHYLINRDRLISGMPLLPLPNTELMNPLPNTERMNDGNSRQNIETEFNQRVSLIDELLKKRKEHASQESTPELERTKKLYDIEIYKKINEIATSQKFNKLVYDLLSEKNITDEYRHTIANEIRQLYLIEEEPPTQVSMPSSSSSNGTPMVTVANPPTQVSMLSSINPEPLVPQPAIIGNQRL